MRNSCPARRLVPLCAGLALLLAAGYGCSSTAGTESTPSRTYVGVSDGKAEASTKDEEVAGRPADTAAATSSEGKEDVGSSVERSTVADGGETAAANADAAVEAPLELSSADSEKIRDLENALRPLETISSLTSARESP